MPTDEHDEKRGLVFECIQGDCFAGDNIGKRECRRLRAELKHSGKCVSHVNNLLCSMMLMRRFAYGVIFNPEGDASLYQDGT